jgi:ADP-ribose pyrophosphatase YjhB (NUDIX family)
MRVISSESRTTAPRRRAATQAVVDRVRCVLRHNKKYLLVQHHSRRRANLDKWRLPGGRLKDDEEPRAGLHREIAEELDYRVSYLVELGDWQHRGETHRVFGCEIPRGIKKFDDDEIRAIGWFTYSDIRGLAEAGSLHTGFELAAIAAFRRRLPD